jgi:chromosome partitioning protein
MPKWNRATSSKPLSEDLNNRRESATFRLTIHRPQENTMIIECQQCSTQFHLDDDATRKQTFTVRCSVCGHLFSAYRSVRVKSITFLDLEKTRQTPAGANVIAIGKRKGGVAKTTTCLNLGASLALFGKRVLLVDFDAQANLTLALGSKDLPTFVDAQKAISKPLSDFIIKTDCTGLSLLPSGQNMVQLNKRYFGAEHFEYLLKDRLDGVVDQFDYILIDTPPSIEFLTLNAMTAAGTVVIPCQCDYLSTHGVDQVLQLIRLIKKDVNPNLESRILFTMLDHEMPSSRMILEKIKGIYQGQTFKTVIDMDGALKEAQILNMPVIHYNRDSAAGAQYIELAREVMKRSNRSGPSGS